MKVRKKKLKGNWMKLVGWLGLLLLIPSLILNLLLFQKTQKLGQGIKVLEVLDGDTILLDGKVRLRLRHMDAPELEFCGGEEAKDLLESLVKDKKVVLEEYILDQQGRPMALIYLGNQLINQEMLKSGWVRYHSDQTSQTKQLKAVADEAKEEKKGIFGPECYQTENLEKPECVIKGNIDKSTGTRLYYYPGCAQYKFAIVEKDIGEDWFCTEKEAKEAGFEKAKTCR